MDNNETMKREEIPFHKTLDNYRIVPRLLIGLYGFMFYRVTEWFMSIPDPTNSQAAFVSTIVGAGAAWFGLYVNSGKRE